MSFKKRCLLIAIVCFAVCLSLTATMVYAESDTEVITAENKWTEALSPKGVRAGGDVTIKDQDYGTLNLSISGTWVGTVTLQVAYDGELNWIETGETWTTNTMQTITCYEPGVAFRIGIATGDFTSGTCNVRLSK